MKKIILLTFVFSLFLSCGTSAVVKEAKSTVAGDWRLADIEYPGEEEELKVSLLDNIPVSCLEGSNWNFIKNNNTGSYVPDEIGCEQDPHFFIWAISENEVPTKDFDLLIKPTDANYKSTTGNAGYRIDLTRLTPEEMLWEQTVTFEGKPFVIKMNFVKL